VTIQDVVPNPDEVATLIVGGFRFDDWESVWVQHRATDGFPQFQFVATERDPLPTLWDRLQFKPGDPVTIYLGGRLAMVGMILRRQTAYDANSHGVQLYGAGIQFWAQRASVVDQTGSFDNMTFEQIARKVYAPFPVKVQVVGTLDATPQHNVQIAPGQPIFDFLETLARPLGIIIGSDHLGSVLLIGDHQSPVTGNLYEGINILRCQCIISFEQTFSEIIARSQSAASNPQNMAKAAWQEAKAPGSAPMFSPLVVPLEQPVWSLAEVQKRAQNEAVWSNGTIVQATIVVQGWLRAGRVLWKPLDLVTVYSPMAMLNPFTMAIQTVTFTQDSESGTLTTLDLVAPWLLKDRANANPSDPPNTAAPGDAQPSTAPPATPPPALVPPAPSEDLPPSPYDDSWVTGNPS